MRIESMGADLQPGHGILVGDAERGEAARGRLARLSTNHQISRMSRRSVSTCRLQAARVVDLANDK